MLVHVMHSTVGTAQDLYQPLRAWLLCLRSAETQGQRGQNGRSAAAGHQGTRRTPPSECDGARAGRRGSTPRAAGRRTKATKRSGACFSCQDGFGDMELGFSRQSKPKPSDSPQNGEAVRNNWNNSRLSLFRLTEPGNPLSTLKKLVLLDSWCW